MVNRVNPTILNLGCGTRTSPATVNIDWSIYLRLHRSKLGRSFAALVLSEEQLAKLRAIDGAVLVRDLRKRLPFGDASVDAVYHSHTLEHIDREDVPRFLAEILRVLKSGGIHRVVVPDFAARVHAYQVSLDEERLNHDRAIYRVIGQSVRRDAATTRAQRPLRRRVEKLVLGDARRRGETHQWAWDRVNLRQALLAAGFEDFQMLSPTQSGIAGWEQLGLDVNADGSPHKPLSLWIEVRKPQA
jgi:SAM-dependent methyltransferase